MLGGTGQAYTRQGCTLSDSRCQLNSVYPLGGRLRWTTRLESGGKRAGVRLAWMSYDVSLAVHGYFYSTEGNSEPGGPETGVEQFGETDRPVSRFTDIP